MKQATKTNKTIQWLIAHTLFGVGFYFFLLLAGDENPRYPLTFREWLTIKVLAAAAIALCVLIGRELHRKGYLDVLNSNDEQL